MKKLTKLTALVLAAACLAASVGCARGNDTTTTAETTAATTTAPNPDFDGSLDGYTVVYSASSSARVKKSARELANAIGCSVATTAEAGTEKVILVGDTDRSESTDAAKALSAAGSKRAYNYSLSVSENNNIVIIGDKPDSIAQAISDVIESYIEKDGKNVRIKLAKGAPVIYGYDFPMITASNGIRFRTEVISEVYLPKFATGTAKGTQYPKVIELQHDERYKGILLATYQADNKGFRVSQSTDGGESWHPYSNAVQLLDKSLSLYWNGHLFELPCQVGDMPAGTVLLSGCCIDKAQDTKTHISIWRSFNGGKNWEQYSIVGEAGGLGEGLWEPCIVYENGSLYCFYSDDSDPAHDQKLVYKKSTDGVNWGDAVECVALEDPTLRPGMISVVKMNNGKYFAPDELVSGPRATTHTDYVYYKILDSLDGDWNPTDVGKRLTAKGGPDYIGSAPWCGYIPDVGENGVLILSSKKGGGQYMYVSFDCGETFEAIPNPLPYEGTVAGYSPSFFATSDGKTLLYAQTVPWKDGHNKIMFARIKLQEAFEIK